MQTEATAIYCDNNSTIKLSKNLVFCRKGKHIDVRYHFLRDFIHDGIIDVVYYRSENQVTDIFTQALKKESFLKFRDMLGVYLLEEFEAL